MKQKIKLGLVATVFLLTGCQVSIKSESHDFISYTQTKNENGTLTSEVYQYDFKTQPKKVFEFPYDSGYPLGVLDETMENVYYTKKQDKNMVIMKHDLKANQDQVLLTRTSAVNYIVPIKDGKLFIVSYDAEIKENILSPFIYDPIHQKLEKIDLKPLISIRDVKYDKHKNIMYLSGWEWEKEQKLLESEAGYSQKLSRNLYALDLNTREFKLLFEVEAKNEYEFFGFNTSNHKLLIPEQNNTSKLTLSSLNLDSLKIDDSEMVAPITDIVAVNKEEMIVIKAGELVKINLTTKEETIISNQVKNVAVNNAVFIQR